MLPYLVIFFLSTFLFYLSSRYEGRWQYVFLLLAILFPSLLAGLRDLTIGRDLEGYAIFVWDQVVQSENIFDLLLIKAFDDIELTYILFNFFISRFTDDIHFFFFVYQLVIMIILAKVFLKMKEHGNAHHFIMFYFLYYYCECLNIMRQSLAIAFALLAVTYLLEKKLVAYYVTGIIVVFCHFSGFILFLIHPLFVLIKKYGEYRVFSSFIICIVALISFVLFKSVVNYLTDSGILMEKFNKYANQEDMNVHKMDLVFFCSIFMYMFYAVKEYDEFTLDLYYLLLVSILFILFGEVTEVANRMAYYFVSPVLMMMPLLRYSSIEHGRLFLLSYVMIFVYFLYMAIVTGFAETIPYSSSLLGL